VDVTDPVLRAHLLTLQGQIEWNTRSLNDGYDLILQAVQSAASAAEGRELAGQLAMLAAALAAFGARSPRVVDLASFAPDPGPGSSPHAQAAAALLRGFVATADASWPAAIREFGRAFTLLEEEPVDDHVLQPNLGIAAMLAGDDERGLRLHEQQLVAARRTGALSMVEHALTRGATFQLATGAWSAAATAAAEAVSLNVGAGQPGQTALPLAELALVAALRGDDEADRHLVDVGTVRERHPVGITDAMVVDLVHWARGLRGSGHPATALHHLEQIRAPWIARMAAIDRLETAVRADRPDLARAWLAELEEFASASGAPAAQAVVAHGRALLAGDDAEQHFEEALAAHAGSLRLADRARTELAYGEHLRRARRRVDARAHLRAALTLFEELGAAPWAERATQELRASGETARKREVSTATDLTAQERNVTALVRQGLSTKDVAAQLFVSPRTVDFHLRNVFGKLGVTSRGELIALALDV
jgi:DNA-binding CsgD family transcriptional regulator